MLIESAPLIGGPETRKSACTISNGAQTATSVHEIAALDPQDGRVRSNRVPGMRGSPSTSATGRVLAHLRERGELQGSPHVFGVPRLRGLHQPGGFGGGDVDAFAVEHRARPRIGAADHDDRDAGAIEPREIGDAGDPKASSCAMTRAIVSSAVKGRIARGS